MSELSDETIAAHALTDFALDTAEKDFKSVVRDNIVRLKSGDLGSLPAILAIVVLCGLFGWANSESFLSRINLANFLEQASAVIVIAMAVSFVLLLGEIDLSAGFTAGVAAAVLATRLEHWSLLPAIGMSALVAIALGAFTGSMCATGGIPSFGVTLCNF